MKKLLVTLGAVAALISPAIAADMAVKALPPAPMAVVDSWTGFYLGAELGGKWADAKWTTTSIVQENSPFNLDSPSTQKFDPSSVRGGVYLGYNWQFAPQWVGGVEADWAGANMHTTTVGMPGCLSASCDPFSGERSILGDAASVKLGWDASVRARLGYLVSPGLLLYSTGGVAWQNIKTSATCQFSLADLLCFGLPGSPFVTVSNTTTRTGWTIGGGIEAKISANWILRGEYRYADFGTFSTQANLNSPGASAPTILAYQLKLNTQIATVGIAYKFGGPVVAKY